MTNRNPLKNSVQAGELDVMTRILYTLEAIGRARQQGGLHVSETLLLGQRVEVETLLDNLAHFANLIDANKEKRHE